MFKNNIIKSAILLNVFLVCSHNVFPSFTSQENSDFFREDGGSCISDETLIINQENLCSNENGIEDVQPLGSLRAYGDENDPNNSSENPELGLKEEVLATVGVGSIHWISVMIGVGIYCLLKFGLSPMNRRKKKCLL